MVNIVTGSSGFIGSHLITKITGDIVPILHDYIHTTNINPFDYFYFCSSYGNLITQTDEFETYKANLLDLVHILSETSYNPNKYKCFVYLSSSSVMLKQQTVYSRSKKAAEEVLLAHMERNDVPICIIRPFSVTGVGEQSTHLIPTLVHAALTGEKVTLAPTPTHDYIDIEDAVNGILSLSEHKARGIYQLGTGERFSNFEVLKIVEEITGKKIQTNFVESLRPYDTDNWVSNNFKARQYGWEPKKTLRDSVKEMYEASR